MKFISTVMFVIGSCVADHVTLESLRQWTNMFEETEMIPESLTPDLSSKSFLVPWGPEVRELQLGPAIWSTYQAVIHPIVDHPELIVKHQADCQNHWTTHLLIREAWFLTVLHESGLVPRIYYVSPPVRMPDFPTEKTRFGMIYADRKQCLKSNKGNVRFMLMDRGIEDLYSYIDSREHSLSSKRAIETLISLLRGIEALHNKNIVHGDIHAGNILRMASDDGEVKIAFIDFGYAYVMEEKAREPKRPRTPLEYVHSLESLWELEGYQSSYRDDVFRALMVGAYMMHGKAFVKHLKDLESDGEEMLVFKRDANIFEFGSHEVMPEMDLSDDTRDEIRDYLDDILGSIRSVTAVHGRPNYKYMYEKLQSILTLLKVE